MTLGPFTRDANIQRSSTSGMIDHAFEAALLIIADIGGGHCFELIGRFCGNKIHHACRRVAAIKRALRPAQNFDLAKS